MLLYTAVMEIRKKYDEDFNLEFVFEHFNISWTKISQLIEQKEFKYTKNAQGMLMLILKVMESILLKI